MGETVWDSSKPENENVGGQRHVKDYILLMLGDATDAELASSEGRWKKYLSALRASGNFDGGSSIGVGAIFKKGQEPQVVESGATGYLRIRAANLEEASKFLIGNPVFEAGGTVEVRELPTD